MAVHSMQALCLAILGSGLLKIGTTAGMEHCVGPVKPVQVVNVAVLPEVGDAKYIEIKLRSEYRLDVSLKLDGVPIAIKDQMVDEGSTQATTSQNGDNYVIVIASHKRMKGSSLLLVLRTQHPCNTIMLGIKFAVLQRIFEEGMTIPVLSVFPKKAYRLDKGDNFVLRSNITYRGDGKFSVIESRQPFIPSYVWNETNIMYAVNGEGAPRIKEKPGTFETRLTNSSASGFKTLIWELKAQVGPSFPFDGSVIAAYYHLAIGPEEAYMYVLTSAQFTDNSKRLPMRIESLLPRKGILQIGYQKRQGFNMLTVGLNNRIPEEKRGISCLALGLETAPQIAAAELTSASVEKGDITQIKHVELLSPTVRVGALSYIEFNVNLPVGSEAYYVCSASVGEEVTTNIIKVIGMVPLEVAIEEARMNQTDQYEATCTASGDPKPSIRLFLVPERDVVWGTQRDEYDAQIPEQYRKYELTESTSQVNVTSISGDSYTVAKTVSLNLADMDTNGFNIECFASTVSHVNQVKQVTAYVYGYNIY